MNIYRTNNTYWTLQPKMVEWPKPAGYPEFVAGLSPDRLTTGWRSLLTQVLGTDEFAAALAEYAATYPSHDITTLRGEHEAAVANRALRVKADRGEACYVRFGALPKRGYSINYRDNVAEPGVSVYRASKVDGNYIIDLSGTDAGSAMFIIGKAQMYEVTGDVVGAGSDGEPCLTNCKARKVNGAASVKVAF